MKVLILNTVKDAKGKVKVKKGDIIPEAQAKKKGVRPCYYEVYNTSQVTASDDEFRFIIRSFMNGGSRVSIREDFRSHFPNSNIPTSSLNRYVAMCEVLSPTHPDSTEMVVSNRLASLWEEMN